MSPPTGNLEKLKKLGKAYICVRKHKSKCIGVTTQNGWYGLPPLKAYLKILLFLGILAPLDSIEGHIDTA